MSLHECNLHCHTVDPNEMDLLSIKNDPGKWLPFIFDLSIVTAAKLTSDEADDSTYNCTTVFSSADTYIIDTPYYTFFKIWKAYIAEMESQVSFDSDLSDDDDDIDL